MSKTVKLILAIIAIAVPLYLLVGVAPLIPKISSFGYAANTVLNRLVSVCCSLLISAICFIIVKVFLKRKIGITKKNFLYGFLSIGWIMMIYTICNFFSNFPSSVSFADMDLSVLCVDLIATLIGCFEIGLVEEAIFRVLSINLFVWVFGEDKKGKTIAIFASSILFGFAHICNLIAISGIINKTIAQVVYAFIIGFYFAVSYVKAENILPAITYHALFDYALYAAHCFYPKELLNETVTTDVPFLDAMINVAWYVPILIYSLLLYTGATDRIKCKIKTLFKRTFRKKKN